MLAGGKKTVISNLFCRRVIYITMADVARASSGGDFCGVTTANDPETAASTTTGDLDPVGDVALPPMTGDGGGDHELPDEREDDEADASVAASPENVPVVELPSPTSQAPVEPVAADEIAISATTPTVDDDASAVKIDQTALLSPVEEYVQPSNTPLATSGAGDCHGTKNPDAGKSPEQKPPLPTTGAPNYVAGHQGVKRSTSAIGGSTSASGGKTSGVGGGTGSGSERAGYMTSCGLLSSNSAAAGLHHCGAADASPRGGAGGWSTPSTAPTTPTATSAAAAAAVAMRAVGGAGTTAGVGGTPAGPGGGGKHQGLSSSFGLGGSARGLAGVGADSTDEDYSPNHVVYRKVTK